MPATVSAKVREDASAVVMIGDDPHQASQSSGDFLPALGQFLGSAAGLSAAVITWLTEQWKAEHRAFAGRDLSAVDYVCLWAIHVNIRLEEHKLCLLVMIGVRADRRQQPRPR